MISWQQLHFICRGMSNSYGPPPYTIHATTHSSIINMHTLLKPHLLPRYAIFYFIFFLSFFFLYFSFFFFFLYLFVFLSFLLLFSSFLESPNIRYTKAFRFFAFKSRRIITISLCSPEYSSQVKYCLQSFLTIFVSAWSCCCFQLHIVLSVWLSTSRSGISYP